MHFVPHAFMAQQGGIEFFTFQIVPPTIIAHGSFFSNYDLYCCGSARQLRHSIPWNLWFYRDTIKVILIVSSNNHLFYSSVVVSEQ